MGGTAPKKKCEEPLLSFEAEHEVAAVYPFDSTDTALSLAQKKKEKIFEFSCSRSSRMSFVENISAVLRGSRSQHIEGRSLRCAPQIAFHRRDTYADRKIRKILFFYFLLINSAH